MGALKLCSLWKVMGNQSNSELRRASKKWPNKIKITLMNFDLSVCLFAFLAFSLTMPVEKAMQLAALWVIVC